MNKLTCTPKEAVETLQKHGFSIGADKLYIGLRDDRSLPKQNRIFPFGCAIKMPNGNWGYVIYTHDLHNFIKEHGGEIGESS